MLPVIVAHKQNVTTLIVSPYSMSNNGTFGFQGMGIEAENYAAQLRQNGLQTTALIAMSPAGIRLAIYSPVVADAFIHAAMVRANLTGMQGYNLDAEFPNDPNATDATQFIKFLNTFADALHACNKTLKVDVHGDGSTPFDFHVWGPMYAASRVDKVITMATYTDAEKNFDKYFAMATFVLTPAKIQPGLEFNAVQTNPRTTHYIISKNVTSIAIWANIPVSQLYWDAMGYFLTYVPNSTVAV
eukprot:m.62630 g.62630  ORF g.62630 m.62630 type:complete len:243 (+) comp23182_c1_seq1:222-950(+)